MQFTLVTSDPSQGVELQRCAPGGPARTASEKEPLGPARSNWMLIGIGATDCESKSQLHRPIMLLRSPSSQGHNQDRLRHRS